MTTLTLITLALVVYGVVGSKGYGRALALGGATPAGAALVVGSVVVPTFYALSIGAAVALGLRLLGSGPAPAMRHERLPPGAGPLIVFFVWTTFVTLIAPVLFDGMTVLSPGPTPNRLTAGAISSPNIAQIVYLALGVCVVVFLARSPSTGPELIGLATGLTTMLSLWRYLHEGVGFPFPENVFDNSPNFTYIETAAGNVQRFRGILSEPAGLATASLVTLSYMVPRSLQLRGWRRAGALAVAGSAAFLGSISTSTTFIIAGGVVAIIATVAFALGFLVRQTSLSAIVSVAACAMAIASIWVLPIVADFVETSINEKVSSSSFTQRSGTDSLSYSVFLDTYGFGAGIGANRASSFLAGVLSTTGIIGTLLFGITVAGLMRLSAPDRRYRPVIWALVSLLVVKLISSPDLSDSSGILWMSLGVLSHAALVRRMQKERQPVAGDNGSIPSTPQPRDDP